MNQELKQALKLLNEKCKEKSWKDWSKEIQSKPLNQRIGTIKSLFLSYVDSTTLNYYKTQMYKTHKDELEEYDDYKITELSKGEKEKAIQELQWLLNDVECCISHLKK